jgi:hypothetical protein
MLDREGRLEAELAELRADRDESVAREKRLRAALDAISMLLEEQATRAVEKQYAPKSPMRYADMLRSFAYDTREALREALAGEGEPPE